MVDVDWDQFFFCSTFSVGDTGILFEPTDRFSNVESMELRYKGLLGIWRSDTDNC